MSTTEVIERLYENAHRFLTEDEIVKAVFDENLSIYDANQVIESLINRGVYVSDKIENSLQCLKQDKKAATHTHITKRRASAPTTFEMLKIPVGSELTFIKDPSIVAITLDDVNQIRLKDGSLQGSVSALARILLPKFGLADSAQQGPRFWLYKGKTLKKIRDDIENM
jgi:hypothetical protein